jgi:hypothetical protein
MGEIADLISILTAIDDAARDDVPRQSDIADLVPAYREPGRFGWASRFRERPDVGELPDLDTAVANLATPTRFASMLPRRLLALAVVARVFPARFGPDGSDRDATLRALITPGLVAGVGEVPTPPAGEPLPMPERGDPLIEDRAWDLLVALADPQHLPRLEDWHDFLRRHAALVSGQLISLPAPCSTTVIERPGINGGGPIALLQTTMCVGGVDLQTLAQRFLNPECWPECSPWWCSMSLEPGAAAGLTRYREVVAIDCDAHLFEVNVLLDFATVVRQTARTVVTYNMSPGQGPIAVDVDRGVIEIRQERDHVRVLTTKRVRFAAPVDTGTLGAIACWVGYGDVATDLICSCSGGAPRAVDCGVASPFTAAFDRLIELARACVNDAGDEARRVADQIGSQSLSAETAAANLTRVVPLAARGWGKLAAAFADVIGDLAAAAPAQPTPLAAMRRSIPFSFVPPLPAKCDVALAGPMRSPYPGEEIDRSRVTIHPGEVGPGAGEFHLDVQVAGLEGTAYIGEAVAKGPDGLEVGRAPVDVIVP